MFGRFRKFHDVVRRQLELFAQDHGELVHEATRELRAYHDTGDPEEAQEHYARYDDLSEDVEEALYDMCDRFAQTIEEPMAEKYVREFDRQARARYRDLIPRLNFLDRN